MFIYEALLFQREMRLKELEKKTGIKLLQRNVSFVTARDWFIVCSCLLVAKLKGETQSAVEINISIKLKQTSCT